MQRFHSERKTKLNLLLESERWRQADVPAEFQTIADHVTSTGETPAGEEFRILSRGCSYGYRQANGGQLGVMPKCLVTAPVRTAEC